jgi:hypothetical protein
MGLERRGRVKWSHDRSNWEQEDLDACDRQAVRLACLLDGSRMSREVQSRPTMDIDLMGRTDNGLEHIRSVVEEIGSLAVEQDGVEFRKETTFFAGADSKQTMQI